MRFSKSIELMKQTIKKYEKEVIILSAGIVYLILIFFHLSIGIGKTLGLYYSFSVSILIVVMLVIILRKKYYEVNLFFNLYLRHVSHVAVLSLITLPMIFGSMYTFIAPHYSTEYLKMLLIMCFLASTMFSHFIACRILHESRQLIEILLKKFLNQSTLDKFCLHFLVYLLTLSSLYWISGIVPLIFNLQVTLEITAVIGSFLILFLGINISFIVRD